MTILSTLLLGANKAILGLTGDYPKTQGVYRFVTRQAGVWDTMELSHNLVELKRRITSEDFKNQMLRNLIYVGVKWVDQAPTITGIIIEILQLLDNVFGLIKIDMADLIKKFGEFVSQAYSYLLGKSATQVSTHTPDGVRITRQQGIDEILDGSSLTALCAGVATIFSGLIVGLGASSFPDGWKTLKKMADNGRSISNFERGVTSAWHIVETVFDMIQKLFNYLLGRRQLKQCETRFKRFNIDILEYVSQVDAFVDPTMSFDDMKKIRRTSHLIKLKNMANQIEGLMLNDNVKVSATAKQIILSKIKEFRTFINGNNFRADDLDRAIPFGMSFIGSPGCGKSLASNLIAKKVTEHGFIENSPFQQDNIYHWMPIKKFMDNYEGQSVVVIDDFNCTTDAKGTESPEHKILQMFSNGPYYPEMASLTEKGRAFVSEVIISSSNVLYPKFESLRSSEAIWRRRNLVFTQVKIAEDGYKIENWRFYRMRPVPNGPDDNGYIDHIPYTIHEVIAMVKVELEKWRSTATPTLDELKLDCKLVEQFRAGKYPDTKSRAPVTPWRRGAPKDEPRDDTHTKTTKTQGKELPPFDIRDLDLPLEQDWDMWAPPAPPVLDCAPINPIEEQERIVDIWDRLLRHLGMSYQAFDSGMGLPQLRLHVELDPARFLDYTYEDHDGTHRLFTDASEFYENVEMNDYDRQDEQAVMDFAQECGNINYWNLDHDSYEYYHLFLVYLKWMTAPETQQDAIITTQQGKDVIFPEPSCSYTSTFNPFLEDGHFSIETDMSDILRCQQIADQHDFPEEGKTWFAKYDAKLRNVAIQITDSWWLQKKWISDDSIQWLEIAVGGIVALMAAIAVYKLCKGWNSPVNTTQEAMNYDGRTNIARPTITTVESIQYSHQKNIKPVITLTEGCANKNTRDMMQGVIKKNLYWMTLTSPGKQMGGNAMIVKGYDLIFPKHYLSKWESEEPSMELVLSLAKESNSRKESLTLSSFVKHPTKDFAWIRLSPSKFQAHKSIVEWIAEDDSGWRRYNGFNCATVSILPDDLCRQATYHYGHATMEKSIVLSATTGEKAYEVNGYDTGISGGEGLCGRLLLDTSAALDKPIVGMHVSGSDNVDNSFFYPITKKDISLMESGAPIVTAPQAYDFKDIVKDFPHFFNETEDPVKIEDDSRLKVVGYEKFAIVSERLAVKPEYETAFEPTILHNKVMENKHCPSPLSLYNKNMDPKIREAGVEPQELAEMKYTKKTEPFSKKLLNFGKEALKSTLMPIEYHDWSVMDLDKALNGDGMYLNPMNMQSSPGTEYQKLSDGHRGKNAYVKRKVKDSEGNLIPEALQKWEIRDEEHKPTGVGGVTNRGKYLLKDLERIETDLKEGREVFSPASSSMKDETLPLEKVWIGKVRLFMTLAMSITILTRRYFGAFLAASVACCTTIPLAIGVDASGPSWTQVYRRMNKWKGRCIAADFKSFDSQADGECMLNAAEVISDIYDTKSGKPDPIGRKVRYGLVYLFIHTYVVCRNLLYRKSQGIPSGIPVTAPLNSCVNVQYLVMCIKALTDAAGRNYSVNQLLMLIEILVYGDDFVVSIAPELEGIITYITMRDWLAQYNIVITPETKDGDEYEYRKLSDEVTFLKRKWVPEPGDTTKIRAPIEMDTIAGIINWQRKKHPPVEMMKSLIDENYLQELFHHGREPYEKGLKALNDALQEQSAKGRLHREMPRYYANDYDERHSVWLSKFN